MNNAQLKEEIKLQRAYLTALNVRIGKLLGTCDEISKGGIPGELGTRAMQECIALLNDEYLGAKLKPSVNAIHKACYKNAKNSLEESRKAEEQNLTALMPACYRPKTKGQKVEAPTVEPPIA